MATPITDETEVAAVAAAAVITFAEAQMALIHDHVSNRHQDRRWAGCPVCEFLTLQNATAH